MMQSEIDELKMNLGKALALTPDQRKELKESDLHKQVKELRQTVHKLRQIINRIIVGKGIKPT